jgi:hypothetical protein
VRRIEDLQVDVYRSSGDTFVRTEPGAIVEICRHLKEKLGFVYLCDVTGADRYTSDERFEVVCYHASLEAYIVRGRELRAEGVTGREADEARWAEAEEGRLSLPEPSIILHILTGEGYDAEEDRILDPFMRWVIYVPYATAESTGLSTEPARGSPWLMYPGTPGAHIMVTPEG